VDDVSDLDFWRQQAHAVQLIHEIELHIAGMAAHGDDIEHYLEGLQAWYVAVFAYRAPWRTRTAEHRRIIEAGDLRLLRALAGHIESLRLVQPLDEDQARSILAALEEAEAAVRSAADVTESTRRYLLGLVAEARRTVLDWQTFGAESARRATLELGGALYTLSEQAVQPERKEAWRQTAKKVTVQIMTGVATQGAIAAGTQAISAL